ncbi:hypothetical protein BSKO_08724 [Bryopsis sp. KO-2023]|nr:hypothetical protein BSKO_08724 [Bryopsis sp. KO-2023]
MKPTGEHARLKMDKSMLRSWTLYVCLAQVVVGFVFMLIGGTMVDRMSKWNAMGVGALSMAMAIVGLVGVTKKADHFITAHVIGVLLCLSILFPMRFSVARNTTVDCAIAELALTNYKHTEIAEMEGGRHQTAFNIMMMRLSAMGKAMDKIHEDPDTHLFNATGIQKPSGQHIENNYYKEIWRAADGHFINEHLEILRNNAHELIETLRQKVHKRYRKVEKAYQNDQMDTKNLRILEDALTQAFEVATTAMRRGNEHLQNRLPEDEMTILEYEQLVEGIQKALSNVMEILAVVEGEIGKENNPLRINWFKKMIGDGQQSGIFKPSLDSAAAVKEAMVRQQQDIYDHVDMGDIDMIKEGWQRKWRNALVSKINKTEMDERSYLDQLPEHCQYEVEQEEVLEHAGLVLIVVQAASIYLMFSMEFKLFALANPVA